MRSVFNEPKNDNNSKTPKIHKLNKPLIVSCETILSLKLFTFSSLYYSSEIIITTLICILIDNKGSKICELILKNSAPPIRSNSL